MKLERAAFHFQDPACGVYFSGDQVHLVFYQQPTPRCKTIANKPRRWGGRPYKPCVSHAQDLIRLALKKPAKTEQEKQRRKTVATKKLEIHRP